MGKGLQTEIMAEKFRKVEYYYPKQFLDIMNINI